MKTVPQSASDVLRIGSLRDARPIRDGNATDWLDVNDHQLMDGRTADHACLQQGDAVFAARAERMASVDGEAEHPAVYQLEKKNPAANGLVSEGCPKPKSDLPGATGTGIPTRGERTQLALGQSGTTESLRNEKYTPKFENKITVSEGLQVQTFYPYNPNLSRNYSIRDSDASAVELNDNRVYVAHAYDGLIASGCNGRFSRNIAQVEPGEPILIPIDVRRMLSLPHSQGRDGNPDATLQSRWDR